MPRVKPQRPILDKNHPLARGLVLDLPFTEMGGDVLDISGHENNGVRAATGSQYQIGRYGPCLYLDSLNSGPVGDMANDGIPITGSDFWTISIILEAKTINPLGSEYAIYERNSIASRATFLLGWSKFGEAVIAFTDDAGVGFGDGTGSGVVKIGVPLAVTVTSSKRQGNLYIDGALNTPFDYSSLGVMTPDIYWIVHDGWYPMNGFIHSNRAWNRALTAQEVASLYVDPWQIYQNFHKQEE